MFDESLSETKSTLSLLPQCPSSLLNSVKQTEQLLKLKKLLINCAILAIKSFFYLRRPADFDAHVGDTLCQIRAYIILCLFGAAKQLSSMVQPKLLIRRLEKAASTIQYSLEKLQTKSYRFKTTSLLYYAKHEGIEIEINGFIELITKSYFLSRFKYFKEDGNIGIDYQYIVQEIQISKTQARKLVHEFQLALTVVSTKFIKTIAINNNHFPRRIINALTLQDEEDRSILPCYLVMSIIYYDMM